tara:strand:- start:369 stop:683 length:315 start_codon:yes stop_codon:yes gene_type:complete
LEDFLDKDDELLIDVEDDDDDDRAGEDEDGISKDAGETLLMGFETPRWCRAGGLFFLGGGGGIINVDAGACGVDDGGSNPKRKKLITTGLGNFFNSFVRPFTPL